MLQLQVFKKIVFKISFLILNYTIKSTMKLFAHNILHNPLIFSDFSIMIYAITVCFSYQMSECFFNVTIINIHTLHILLLDKNILNQNNLSFIITTFSNIIEI